jgi:hypothetical protein
VSTRELAWELALVETVDRTSVPGPPAAVVTATEMVAVVFELIVEKDGILKLLGAIETHFFNFF